TNILTRAPLNIEIAEEICKLQINNIAKIFILERIVEADFLNGLIIRKEFLEFENQNELIWYIDKLDVILNNYGFEMKNLIQVLLKFHTLYMKIFTLCIMVHYVKMEHSIQQLRCCKILMLLLTKYI